MLEEMFGILEQSSVTKDKAKIYSDRRDQLLALIEEQHGKVDGSICLFAPFESGVSSFLQDSSFFYFSGISEPATAITFDRQNGTAFYKADFGKTRDKWMHSSEVLNNDTISLFGIDLLKSLGSVGNGYQVYPYFSEDEYIGIITFFRKLIADGKKIFTLYPEDKSQYASLKFIVDRLALFVPDLHKNIVDISSLVAKIRRKKEMVEIEQIYHSIGVTNAALHAATHLIRPGTTEAEVHAALEYIFIENNGTHAYPSIVAGGGRATILHYHANNNILSEGQAVLIDAGAMINHYCADISRTYPISGRFSERQRELYKIVLEVQKHVVDKIKPGMWLSNPKEQEMSLQHIAISFFKKEGMDKYFNHGIGHFLGLDVHDVGSVTDPLQAGDIITIEPGIYIPEEEIGIRIEDNYWILADAEPVCMSEDIPKEVNEVEEMVNERFDIDAE